MELDEARRWALSFPEATEEPHFEMSSFRVGGKIFATVPADEEHLHVFLDEGEARAAVPGSPGACSELWWGKRLTGVRLDLAEADPAQVRELLEDAWRRRAPKRVAAAYDAGVR